MGVLIGGDALNGTVENGQYYLGGGGKHTEVNWFVFTYSKLHAISVLITHLLAILASLVYWATGGTITKKAATRTIKEPPHHPILYRLFVLHSFAWEVLDTIEGVFWQLFDSWRRPDVEFFTRLSKEESLKELFAAFDRDPRRYQLKEPIAGYLYGTHFCLLKQRRYILFFTGNVVFLTLFGRLVQTPQGTYVRAWHRPTTMSISFFTVWFGTAIIILSIIRIIMHDENLIFSFLRDSSLIMIACGIVLILTAGFMLLLVQIGSWVGARTNDDLARFLQQVLAS